MAMRLFFSNVWIRMQEWRARRADPITCDQWKRLITETRAMPLGEAVWFDRRR